MPTDESPPATATLTTVLATSKANEAVTMTKNGTIFWGRLEPQMPRQPTSTLAAAVTSPTTTPVTRSVPSRPRSRARSAPVLLPVTAKTVTAMTATTTPRMAPLTRTTSARR